MAIYELDGQAPELPPDGNNFYRRHTQRLIGKVRLLNSASVWFGAVLRGDNEWIEIGEGLQCAGQLDLPYRQGLSADDRQGLHGRSHNVILHGCTLEDGSLVGMGSIVMNGAKIGRGSIVGAGAVITEGKLFPRIFADHRCAGAGDPRAGSRASREDGRRREILCQQWTTLQKRPEEDRLSSLLNGFP